MSALLSKERIVAQPGFNRWLVPPAALCIHLCIGMAYGFSVFWLPLTRSLGITKPIACPADMSWIAMLFTTSPLLMNAEDRAAFGRVEKEVKLSRYGGDCYAYCMLAAGHIDLVIESGLNAFDIMALIPIVEGAGGIITSWDGGSAKNGGRVIAAGDKRVNQGAVTMLAATNDG